ncbi:DUF1697 domain-containing protein [Paenibacillus sedimenti]|uniref:DUF1697 domain-containing protein n=1 Tax=Paenibacillus sedimenti TaxID=2770274 RepID=A0A926KVM3_9BACL|nr:DUF1697 domain-containing protein [Paenibacillus sedimenti]MBD0383018.1 DUF1697 domain-containing protein [Paenibacillus sedimenti]
MPKYVSLLRGINVSGQKIIKMDHLRGIYESMNFGQVISYIQSGNVIFNSTEEDVGLLRDRIQSELARVFVFEVPVVVRTPKELEEVVSRNPFLDVNASENESLYVAFLAKEPSAEAIVKLNTYQNEIDQYHVLRREVYILCRKGFGKSQFSNNFLEKKLAVTATTRNWETVNKLIQLADKRS